MIQIPVVAGVIRRRILVNYRVDPSVIGSMLPSSFRPKLVRRQAIGGICLIRLESIRPAGLPSTIGLASENAAHRVAVEWDDVDGVRSGVFIFRRDTNSLASHWAGGRIFSGEHHLARFTVDDRLDSIDFAMESEGASVRLRARTSIGLPPGSIFESTEEASEFLKSGSVGFSRLPEGRLECVRLDVARWQVDPLDVDDIHSSYFDDELRFPRGSVAYDSAFLMRDVVHEWHTLPA